MDEYDDYPVAVRSDDDMEGVADEIRVRLGMSECETLSALEMLERLETLHKVEIVVRPDVEMGRKEAYVTWNPDRIFVSHSTHRAIVQDVARARMTVAHEAIHYFAHQGAPKARASDGNKTPNFIKPYASAERQARVGAAALLMPRAVLRLVNSADELQSRCGVSREAAEIRFARWARGTKKRPELPFVRAHLDYLESLTPQRDGSAKAAKLRHARSLWEELAVIDGEYPNVYRLCSQETYRISWSEFEQMTECGWFIQNRRATAWIAIRP